MGNIVAGHTGEISDIHKAIAKIEREIKNPKEQLSVNETANVLSIQESVNYDQRRERYCTSRRSLRLWPIPGVEQQEIREATIKFIFNVLAVDPEDFDAGRVARTRRIRSTRTTKTPFEVLVTFDEKYTRDCVARCAKKLEKYRDSEGNPTAGMKIDYPAFLGHIFRDLE